MPSLVLPLPHQITTAPRPLACRNCGTWIAVGERVAFSLKPPRQRLDPVCVACFSLVTPPVVEGGA